MRAFPQLPSGSRPHAELPGVSTGYPPPRGRLPTCSAPVRRVSDPKVTPLDLHALGTPPALILSQDQTLHHCSLLCLPSLCPDCSSHPTHPDPKTCVGVCGRNSLARAPACRRPRHQSPVTLTCAKERKTDNHAPSPPPCLHQDAPETDSPLAPSSADVSPQSVLCSPNCQLVKVSRWTNLQATGAARGSGCSPARRITGPQGPSRGSPSDRGLADCTCSSATCQGPPEPFAPRLVRSADLRPPRKSASRRDLSTATRLSYHGVELLSSPSPRHCANRSRRLSPGRIARWPSFPMPVCATRR